MRSSRTLARAVLLAIAAICESCGGSPSAPEPPLFRPYYLAFTPFPYVFTNAALDYTYSRIGSDADMIAHHLGSFGVPWPEALADSFPYNANVMGEWETRRSRTRPGQRVYLALSPVNQTRNGVANIWASTGSNLPPPAPWNGYALNAPQVKLAYLAYCRRAIAYFNPSFVTIGIEVNQIMSVDPGVWAAYVDTQRSIYTSLKALYPSLPIMVSLDANHLLGYENTNVANQDRARSDIADLSDMFCLSVYPYVGANAGGLFPADMFDRLAAMTSKPMAICETGYPSQGFTLRSGLTVRADSNAQKTFIDRLFAAADKNGYRFIVYFFLRDLEDSLDFSDTIRTFRFDGLYDANGNGKPALTSWKQRLAAGVRASALADAVVATTERARVETDTAGTRCGASGCDGVRESALVYANDNRNGSNTVSAFVLDQQGTLSPVAESPVDTGGIGTGLWRGVVNDIVATASRFLYVANHRSGDISAFAIDSQSGRLTPVRDQPFRVTGWTTGDIALAAGAAGDMLAAGNLETNTIAVFSVAPDGSLHQRGPTVAAGGAPTALRVSPDSRFLAATLAGDGRIAVFRVDPERPLAPVDGSPFFGGVVNAGSVDFACDGSYLYAANAPYGRSTVTSIDVFRIASSGTLAPLNTTAIASPAGGGDGTVLLLNPDNRLVFVTSHGIRGARPASINVLRVSGNSLSFVSAFPLASGSVPVGMATTRSGRFVVSADYPDTRDAPGSVAVFAVTPDGSLSPAPGSPFMLPGSSLSSVATFPPAACGVIGVQ